jgi:hypothetical protein
VVKFKWFFVFFLLVKKPVKHELVFSRFLTTFLPLKSGKNELGFSRLLPVKKPGHHYLWQYRENGDLL